MKTINFLSAFEAVKDGHRVARLGWNGKSMWLILFSHSAFITIHIEEGYEVSLDISKHSYTQHIGETGTRIGHIGIIDNDENFYPISDFLLLKTADNKVIPWNFPQADTLAEDWVILKN